MHHNKLKNKFLFPLIFIFLFLFFTPLFVKAEEEQNTWGDLFSSQACPCAPSNTLEKKYVRMQLAIPGITETCPYKKTIYVGSKMGTQTVNCYYTEANLPDFIRKIYNFSIGIIAIMAVIVIMISGFKWILAAGNPGTIGKAQDDIKAAVSGLILILLSYTILNLVNPKLINLQLTQPTQIETIQRSAEWCKDLKNTPGSENAKIREENTTTWITDFDNTVCGKKYEIENSDGTCWGDGGCPDKQLCYRKSSFEAPGCLDSSESKSICEKQDENNNETGNFGRSRVSPNRTSGCDEVDDIFKKMNYPFVCSKQFEGAGDDECEVGEELQCDVGYQRVNCEESEKCSKFDTELKQKIAKSPDDYARYKLFCINEPRRAAKGSVSICCKKTDSGDYVLEDENTKK